MKQFIIWSILLIIFASVISWFVYLTSINTKLEIEPGTIITISAGQGVSQIAVSLQEKNLIKSALFFKIYAKLSGNQFKLQAGDYLIKDNISIKDLINLIASGDSLSNEKVVLIKEGLNIREINNFLREENIFSDSSFLDLAQTKIKDLPAEFDDYKFLQQAPAQATLEGYLFPDSYRLFADATSQDLIIKMLDNFENKVSDEFLDEIKRQNKSLHQIIIMASLLEKEVRTESDMKIVSGLFWNRIDNGQPLGASATLTYILGVKKSQYTTADTQINSPYNTYKNPGLPPGPITNPGLRAIKAAIYPIKTDYNYFLSRPDTGATVFSKTFNEHIRNKTKYLP